MKTINEEAQFFYLRFYKRLLSYQNPLIKNLSTLILQEILGAGQKGRSVTFYKYQFTYN